MKRQTYGWFLSLGLLVLTACGGNKDTTGGAAGGASGGAAAAPTFSLSWSEYPSWSVFGVADELGLINGAAGEMGEIEKEFGVDIELKEAGYDSCLNMFTSNECDAVCMTNMDALIVSPSRPCVAVLPTSTSYGADACLVTEAIADIDALKSQVVHGLENTVSQYCFVRCLEVAGKDEKDYTFKNLDPAVAATSMQQRSDAHQAIM
ncbi:MAG: hypothetical protein KDA92_25765, partial [Planctomycetales bacterium]|nr:hypothetical protein [Planctomycetales bacterium]